MSSSPAPVKPPMETARILELIAGVILLVGVAVYYWTVGTDWQIPTTGLILVGFTLILVAAWMRRYNRRRAQRHP